MRWFAASLLIGLVAGCYPSTDLPSIAVDRPAVPAVALKTGTPAQPAIRQVSYQQEDDGQIDGLADDGENAENEDDATEDGGEDNGEAPAAPDLPEVDFGADADDDPVSPSAETLDLADVVISVYGTYPLVQAALTGRVRATGAQLEALSPYDYNLNAQSENQGVSFYENFRHKVGLTRNIYEGGGQWFAQYKLGRGEFEPWYLERETKEGGEFSVGLIRPLARNRTIDAARSRLWRSIYERQRIEPLVRAQLVDSVLAASRAYWSWVAASERVQLARRLLDIAEVRNEQVAARVAAEDLAEIVLTENQRLVLTREAALVEAERVLAQAAYNLSAYYRTPDGEPIVAADSAAPTLAGLAEALPDPAADLQTALAARPQLQELSVQLAQAGVSLAEAQNLRLPRLDAGLELRQDVGGRAKTPDTKTEFEAQASVFFEIPLERRQARGLILQSEAAIARLTAQRKLAADRVAIELFSAAAAVTAARERVDVNVESLELAEELVEKERERFRLEGSSLLEVTLREQQLAASAAAVIDARFAARLADADYRAALSVDRLPEQSTSLPPLRETGLAAPATPVFLEPEDFLP